MRSIHEVADRLNLSEQEFCELLDRGKMDGRLSARKSSQRFEGFLDAARCKPPTSH
jgi:hypothetical protein